MSPPAVYIAKASQDHLRNGVELSAATGSNFRFLFFTAAAQHNGRGCE